MKWVLALCLSTTGFFVSLGLGTVWPLAWVAAVPVLHYAWTATGWRGSLALAFLAYALGNTSVLGAYAGVMPASVIVMQFVVLGALFALAVAASRLCWHRLGALAAVTVFAALWAGLDYLVALVPAAGSVTTPAASQVDAFRLAQLASVFGFTVITALMGAVSAALAAAWAERSARWLAVALAVFAANAVFGAWRAATPAGETLDVLLVSSDDQAGPTGRSDEQAARRVIDAYAAAILSGPAQPTDLIVLPENLARLDPAWRDAALRPLLAAAQARRATLVGGFNTRFEGRQANVAVRAADGTIDPVYAKRRLVAGLETQDFAPGDRAFAERGIGIAICKDMDFQAMIRRDVADLRPRLLAVPAWDFSADGWSHARVAILRSIETGVPMARASREGRLTANDRYGRLLVDRPTGRGFAMARADVPLAPRGETTWYTRLGDVFPWFCLALGGTLLALALRRGKAGFPTGG